MMKAVFSLHRLGYGSRFVPIIPKNAKSNDMKNVKKWKKSQRTLLIDFYYILPIDKISNENIKALENRQMIRQFRENANNC